MQNNDKTITPEQLETLLNKDMSKFIYDPLGHVMYSYQWGKGELAGFDGPEEWQRNALIEIGKQARARKFNGRDPVVPIQMATASGHGIGKSAFTAWLVNWILDTRPLSRGTVTANTSPQLEGKTWAEISKWRRRSIMAAYYDVSTGKGNMRMSRKGYKDSWFCKAETCREENSESFAGQHAITSTSFYIFDEASAVPDKIWEVAEGGLTDGEPMWFAFGNPTRNSGRFHKCFHGLKHRWIHNQIDSRTVSLTNKQVIADWAKDYGEDSDFFKVRVRGVFPSMSAKQFISGADIDAARGRHLRTDQYDFAPKILTLDPAWDGDDELVIGLRQGLCYKTLKVMEKNDNDVHIANIVAMFEDEHKADAVIVDAGYGTGIVSAARTMGRSWHLVWFSGESPDAGCLNMRAHMANQVRLWLKSGAAIPDDEQLYNELMAIETVPRLDGKIQLEAKKDYKRRVGFSPNRFDALGLSFAINVTKKAWYSSTSSANMYVTDYDRDKI
jgi:hypothetical protein